jgi:DNA-binding MarR family transcriptional regulator
MTSAAESIAASLGQLLQRRFRATVYADLVEGIDAVDAAAYPVISGVARLAPVRVAVLGEEVGLDRSIVSRRAARLIEAGLLRSDPDPRDPRAALLSLTAEGERAVGLMRQRLTAILGRQLDDWPPGDRQRFAELFARFTDCWPAAPSGGAGKNDQQNQEER